MGVKIDQDSEVGVKSMSVTATLAAGREQRAAAGTGRRRQGATIAGNAIRRVCEALQCAAAERVSWELRCGI
jgi:hypothetical protein